MNKVAIVAKMEDIHGLKHEFPLTKSFLGYHHCWMLNLPAEKINTSLHYGCIPWMDQTSTWWQVDFIVPFLSCAGQRFSLYRIESSSEYGLAITTCNDFVYTTINLQNASPTIMVFYPELPLLKELIS